jgi:hypothetical protein
MQILLISYDAIRGWKRSSQSGKILERAKGLEPSTPTLARSCSTTELHPHPSCRRSLAGNGRPMPNAGGECNSPCRVKTRPRPPNQSDFPEKDHDLLRNGAQIARNGSMGPHTGIPACFRRPPRGDSAVPSGSPAADPLAALGRPRQRQPIEFCRRAAM